MSLPTIEIVKLASNEAYLADPVAASKDATDIVQKTPGYIAHWHGLESSDSKYLYLVIAWESLEHHHALMNDAVVYPTLKVALGKMSSALLWMNHVKFPESVEPSLEAPVTEFAIWDLHESTDAEKFLDTLKGLRATVRKDCPGEVFPGSAGPTVENPRKYIVCLGWHSIERFQAAIKNTPSVTPYLGTLTSLATLDLKHVKLTKV